MPTAETKTVLTYDSATDLVLADDLFLYVTSGDSVVAFATAVNVEITGDEIDASSKMSGAWKANLAGKYGYTLSSDALYTQLEGAMSFDSMMAEMVKRTKVDWKVGKCVDRENFALDTSKPYYSGQAFITSLSLNAGSNEVASCSISMTGNGEIKLNMPA